MKISHVLPCGFSVSYTDPNAHKQYFQHQLERLKKLQYQLDTKLGSVQRQNLTRGMPIPSVPKKL